MDKLLALDGGLITDRNSERDDQCDQRNEERPEPGEFRTGLRQRKGADKSRQGNEEKNVQQAHWPAPSTAMTKIKTTDPNTTHAA